ncbi:molybdopterin-binding protein [Paenibacillus flagellatus]|uniref:Molybdopterin molybdenumtransferase n=1 Tax=Paenibacillus flagellatus TaxID=2211139 RepID=A0A2V5K1F1_9BACL|nr:molybdopterin-binding protein [Paenibacillus flagellatus]PYI52921.1 molybdopterin-binding protein [Paenibacillus flagellatus]
MSRTSVLREVKVEEAVGLALAHDLTRIVPGEFKGRLFRKGHVIREEDISELKRIGKEHIYVLELGEDDLHENDAAIRMARAACGSNVTTTEPSEGKVMLKSAIRGLARVDKSFVDELNGIEQLAMATLPTNTVVSPGQSLAGTRVIPLLVAKSKVEAVERAAERWRDAHMGEGPISVTPFRTLHAGVITTGSEVYNGLVEDKFGPVVRAKLEALGSSVAEQRFCKDDSGDIVREIDYFLASGVDLILVTGGMSVDPDDRTPGAIKQAGARIVSHGTPMLPGSMLLVAYLGDVPILGLPGSVMHDPFTVFDVLLPRLCAGIAIERSDITELGYGGLFADRG